MTIHEANQILTKVEFLHYRFGIVSSLPGMYTLEVRIQTPDTRNRDQVIGVIHQSPINLEGIQIPEQFIEVVWAMVKSTLVHEAGELFKVEGKDIFNEHHGADTRFHMIQSMFQNEQTDRTTWKDRAGVR